MRSCNWHKTVQRYSEEQKGTCFTIGVSRVKLACHVLSMYINLFSVLSNGWHVAIASISAVDVPLLQLGIGDGSIDRH
jgi:hypothetical protein